MKYKVGVLIGLIGTILYFDFTKEYHGQMLEISESLSFWRTNECILSDRFNRLISTAKPWASSVFIGFNGNIDVILNGAELIKALGNVDIKGKGFDKSEISSVADLQNIFTNFFHLETAAERFVDNENCWNEIVNAISSIDRKTNYIGGNAALMARTMSFNNVKIKLAVPGGPELMSQLKQYDSIDVIEACKQTYDELHVIMEYGVNEIFAGHRAKRANRFIFSRDIANSEMSSTDCINAEILKGTDIVVVAGFHMLESQATAHQLDTLAKVRELVEEHPLVHLELASMTKAAFLKDLFFELAVHVHSLGLNEAELEFLSAVLDGNTVNVKDPTSVQEAMIFVLEKAGSDSKLSRIHFHCLSFHMIVEGTGKWKDGEISVAAGTYIAAKYACDSAVIAPHNHTLMFQSAHPYTSEEIGGYTVHTSPVLVCKNPLKTVGLGDSISATGLLYSSRYNPANDRDAK